MGGFGSSRQGSLPVIENGLKLDLRRMRKQGLFVKRTRYSGRMVWSNSLSGEQTSSIGISYNLEGTYPWFGVKYSVTNYDGERVSVDERFDLERFPQPFGGYRWYFICPETFERAQCLYLPPGATRFRSRDGFRCRLQYRSQCEDRISRLTTQQHKLSRRVKELGPPEWQESVTDWDFPSKPPGMHWRTYEKFYERWEAYARAWNFAVGQWLVERGCPDDLVR